MDYQQMSVFLSFCLESGDRELLPDEDGAPTVRDVGPCMARHMRISALSANLCTQTTLNKELTSRQQ